MDQATSHWENLVSLCSLVCNRGNHKPIPEHDFNELVEKLVDFRLSFKAQVDNLQGIEVDDLIKKDQFNHGCARLNNLVDKFFDNTERHLTPAQYEKLLKTFISECKKEVNAIDEIAGKGWLYRAVEKFVNEVVSLLLNIVHKSEDFLVNKGVIKKTANTGKCFDNLKSKLRQWDEDPKARVSKEIDAFKKIVTDCPQILKPKK